MKPKRFVVFVIIILLLFTTGCRSEYQYKYAQAIEKVERIALVQIEDGKESVLAELDNFNILADIQGIPCKKYWNDPCQTLNGLAVKIFYNDSTYEIITSQCNAHVKDNNHDYGWEYFDKDAFNDILQSYLISNEILFEEDCIPDKETAVKITDVLIENFQQQNYFLDYVLQSVFYDTEDQIWIVTYAESRDCPGACVSIALRKENCEVVKIWVGE